MLKPYAKNKTAVKHNGMAIQYDGHHYYHNHHGNQMII